MCCKDGKVAPPTFPDHPDPLKQLWEENHPYSATFLKYTGQLNDSLAMACLKVDHPPGPDGHHGWQPTVTIQGKVSILMGGPQSDEGQKLKFAKLYVMDPDNAHEKQVLFNLTEILQQHLRKWNLMSMTSSWPVRSSAKKIHN